MDYQEIYKDKNFGKIIFDTDLKDFTSFGIGGRGDCLVFPENEESLGELLSFNYENNIPTTIIGRGSNLLVSDRGIRGCVIILSENFSKIEADGEVLTAQAGARLKDCMEFSLKESLTGLEEISGIPGSVGGAVAMNAGAYGKEIKDVCLEVRAFDRKGQLHLIKSEDMNFSYRHSKIFDEDLVVASAKFALKKGNQEEILERYEAYTEKRASKQPLEMKSAGSTFKRPEGSYASKLIDESGLRGFRIGDCQVSEKHCGFIVNRGSASCQDMVAFIEEVRRIVKEKTGFNLEREVKLMGEF